MFLTYKNLSFEIPELVELLPKNKSITQLSTWKISNNKLLISSNHDEIVANWVNATLTISIDPALNYDKYDECYKYYESAWIIFQFNRGEIINKYIEILPKSIRFDNRLYSDRLILPKNKSFTNSLYNDFKYLLREEYENFVETPALSLIKELVTSIRNEYFYNRSLPSFDFFQNGHTMLDLLISELSITVGSNFIFLYSEGGLNDKYQELLRLYFLHISSLIETSNNIYLKNNEYCYKSYKLDIEFVKWAILNLKWFVLSPAFFSKPTIIEQNISLEKIRDVFFEYELISNSIEPLELFTRDEVQLNYKKINLKYNFEEKKLIYKPTDKRLLFDVLLNDAEEINNDILNNIEYNTDKNLLTYKEEEQQEDGYDGYDNYNSNNWLRDAAGTDDPETMNDVYWNLD